MQAPGRPRTPARTRAARRATGPTRARRPARSPAVFRRRRPRLRSSWKAFGGDPRDLRRRAADRHAGGLERLGLRGSGTRGAGDDRTRMPHALAGRGLEPRDVRDDGLRDVLGDERRRALLVVAADLAGHDDQIGVGVRLEQPQGVDEPDTVHGVAAHPDTGRLPDPRGRELMHDLVHERARAAHEPDAPGRAHLPRDDPHVRHAGRDDARAVRADERRRRAGEVGVHRRHIADGDPFRDAHRQGDTGIGGLEDRLRGEPWRHEDHGGVRARLVHPLGDGVVHRDPLDILAALAGRHARDNGCAVRAVAERVERPLRAGDALDQQLGTRADEDAHAAAPASRAASSAAASIVATGTIRGWAASARIRGPSPAFVPSRRTTIGTAASTWPSASRMPSATTSQRVMPPKMLMNTHRTDGSDRMTWSDVAIFSALAPPPTSKKLAARPPACATTSSVDMTRPAPLPMMPTDPSSLTYCRSASFARFSTGSTGNTSCSASRSGWRNSALSSTVTFASRATIDPSSSCTSGLISTRVASVSSTTDHIARSTCAAPSRAPTGNRPVIARRCHARSPSPGLTWMRRSASGRSRASVSMSMPPSAVSIQRYSPTERSSTTEV